MHQRKSKKILVYFFLLIIISTINNNFINNLNFNTILKIKISGLDQKDSQNLLNKLNNLNLQNIFFINKKEIIELINSNSLIERYEIFKTYPSTINIDIEKTNFFAKINNNGKIFLIGSNGKLTLSDKSFNDLPFIFGKPSIDEFLKFKKILEKSKFSYDQIENLYFFPSKRWDIKLKENILLKLPSNFNKQTLNHLYAFLKNYNKKNLAVVDYRIKNQIILNE